MSRGTSPRLSPETGVSQDRGKSGCLIREEEDDDDDDVVVVVDDDVDDGAAPAVADR